MYTAICKFLQTEAFFRQPVVIISRDCCWCVQMLFFMLLLMSNLRSPRKGQPYVSNTYVVVVFMLLCLLSFVGVSGGVSIVRISWDCFVQF